MSPQLQEFVVTLALYTSHHYLHVYVLLLLLSATPDDMPVTEYKKAYVSVSHQLSAAR